VAVAYSPSPEGEGEIHTGGLTAASSCPSFCSRRKM
jgi:hypothetical protein